MSGPKIDAEENAWQRKIACVNAFLSPDGRTIATEDISEALFWRMYDLLEILGASPPDYNSGREARALLSTLRVEEPENG